MPDDRLLEVEVGDYVLLLDGHVVEVLHRNGSSSRFHVRHVAVEAKPDGDGLRLTVGVDVQGLIVNGAKLTVPPEKTQAVLDLFGRARAIRDDLASA